MQDLRLPYVRLDGSTPVPERLATVDTCVLNLFPNVVTSTLWYKLLSPQRFVAAASQMPREFHTRPRLFAPGMRAPLTNVQDVQVQHEDRRLCVPAVNSGRRHRPESDRRGYCGEQSAGMALTANRCTQSI